MESIPHSDKNYFRIPEVKSAIDSTKLSTKSNVYVIGIIDASGSMRPFWEDLSIFWNEVIPKENCTTLTFDTTTRVSESGMLEPEIGKHGGGGTDIPNALKKFEETLKKLPPNTPVTAIFISDGQDNRLSTLEDRVKELKGNFGYQVNFICLGIQKAFPTFLSMRLREIYHSGDSAIPAVYLIEFCSQTAFFNKFESMRKYFFSSGSVSIEPPVIQYPWETEPVHELYEGTWCLTNSKELKLNGQTYPVSDKLLGIEESVDLFRGWVQNLQILSLRDFKLAEVNAKIALPKMNALVDDLSKLLDIDIRTFFIGEIEGHLKDEALVKFSFSKRAKISFLARYGNRIVWFLKEAELLASGASPKFQSEFEAAKRLNLGTITGKYHQRALALKGISIEEFLKIKTEFIEIHKKLNLNPEIVSSQESSVITLMNQRAIFTESDFLDGFQYVNSPYDIVETFPVVGLGVKVKRFDGSLINPWLITVKQVATQNKAIDSVFLFKNAFNVSLEAGNDKKDELTGIIPLFNEDDTELGPLLTSRLYRFMMTYLSVQNVDTYYEEAHLALLANLMLHIFSKEKNEWRDGILSQIISTLKICYSGSSELNSFIETLLKSSKDAYVGEVNQDISKQAIHLFYGMKTGIITQEQGRIIFNSIMVHFFKKFLATKDTTRVLTYEYTKNEIAEVESVMKESVLKYFSLSEFRKNVEDQIKLTASKLEKTLVLNTNVLNDSDLKADLITMSGLYEDLFNEKFSESQQICLAIHTIIHGDEGYFKDVDFNLKSATATFFSADTSVETSKNSQFKVLHSELNAFYKSTFAKIHREVIPMSKEIIFEKCAKLGKDFNKLNFTETNLCSNACVSEGCTFFLEASTDFKKHMDSWAGNLPLGFHRFVKNHHKEGIDGMLVSAKKKWGKTFPTKFNETEEFVKDYISKLLPILGTE